jgi:putative ABC transport system ATP-binding protein
MWRRRRLSRSRDGDFGRGQRVPCQRRDTLPRRVTDGRDADEPGNLLPRLCRGFSGRGRILVEYRAVLILRQLCRSFREGERVHRVLDHADAQIQDGAAVAVIGRSGSGKSTLLNVISGIDRADSGVVEFAGRDVTALAEPARTLFRRAHVGFVYQFFNLIPTLDVEENVRLVLELNGVRGPDARRRSAAMLAEVGLGDRLHSAVDRLSGGEQQRVAIARALVHEPALLLADEPTGNLDEETARQVLPVLLSLTRARGATLLIVTHDSVLARSADRVLELREGRLRESVAAGAESAPAVLAKPGSDNVAADLRSANERASSS